ncbi:MAG: hypothetical protein HXS54_12510 [Theionarchaea archaeon]|nr:hypothetical protein [Theionarchaea archaeon]
MNPSDKKKNSQVDERGDYIFHFEISPSHNEDMPDEPLTEFVRCQLRDLLQIIVLTHNGERVKVNGFQFLNDTEREHKIWK